MGKKGKSHWWLTELKLSCLKVKHGNNTKRPHILGTSTRDTRKRRTLPCGVPMGQDIEIGTHTFVDFTCHPQPTTKLGKEWNQLQKNSARCKVEPTSLHLQVFLVFFLLVVFAIRLYASATLFKKTSKKRFENNAHKK